MNICELNCKMFECTRSILKSVTVYTIIILATDSEDSINTTYSFHSIHNKCFNFCRRQCVWIICSSGRKTERCGYVYGILILPIDTVQAYKGKRTHTSDKNNKLNGRRRAESNTIYERQWRQQAMWHIS